MSHDLVPADTPHPLAGADLDLAVVPALVAAAGERASVRFIEFFTANIRNKNTRTAYALAVRAPLPTRDEGTPPPVRESES